MGPGETQMTWLPDTCPSTSVRFPKAQEIPADRSGASLTTRLSCRLGSDTEMLLGCTSRLMHWLMLAANRFGSQARWHVSLREHLP